MKRLGLTMVQLRVLNFLRDRAAVSEVAPTLQEIADACDLKCKSRAHYLIKALNERGHVDYAKNRKRSIILREFTASSVSRVTSGVAA